MALLKFISLSVGSLLLFQGAYANESHTATEAQDCVDLMNTARQEAGLPSFSTPGTTYLKGGNETTVLQTICGALQPQVRSGIQKTAGTVAYYKQGSKNCSEAVAKWKEGFSAFSSYTTSVPPAFQTAEDAEHQLGAAPYDTQNAINFAALYSAKSGASAECAFVTCSASSDEARQASGSGSTPTTAMICITYPEALTDDGVAPWTQEQWNKILAALDPSFSSANAAVPTLLALAAAAVGVALM